MAQIEINHFKGVDLRKLPETDDGPNTARLVAANNVTITPGNSIAVRAQLRLFATVDSSSIGLYSVGNQLRCAFPQRGLTGPGIPRPPAGIEYDVFSDAVNVATNGADGQINGTVEEVANVVLWRDQPYLVLGRRPVGQVGSELKYEHHLLPSDVVIPVPVTVPGAGTTVNIVGVVPPNIAKGSTLYFSTLTNTTAYVITDIAGTALTVSPSVPGAFTGVAMVRPYLTTKVSTPFAPGRALTLVGTKIFASDIDTNNTPFSSTINGPTDWTNPGDAGVLNTSLHADGYQRISGLGVFNGMLTVLYERSMQVWRVGADPATHTLYGTVGGAGTMFPRSIANVMGDVFYFSAGGYRSVSSVITTGQLKPDDIGAPIQPLTKTLDPRTMTMLATWSEALSAYVSIVGTTGYVYTLSPNSRTRDWTPWTLPWEISAFAEQDGNLYVRRAGTGEIYVFDAAYSGETGFTWTATTDSIDGGQARIKRWLHVSASQSGEADWNVATEPRNPTVLEYLGRVDGSMSGIGLIPINVVCHRIAFNFSGTKPWTIDQLRVEADLGNYV